MHLCGWHPHSRFKGRPVDWWVSAVSFRDGIGAVIWPAIKQFLPMKEVRSITWGQRAEPETPSAIVMRNGSTCVFKSVEQGRVKFQGDKLHGIWIDEEHPPDIVEECRARLLDHAGYLTVTLTPVRRERWVLRLEKESGTLCVRASTMDAARAGTINLQATVDFARNLPERQRRVRIEGDHVALEGAVWPEFTRETHVVTIRDGQLWLGSRALMAWPPPQAWSRWCAIDFGYNNPTAVVLAIEDPHHTRLIVTRVYYSPGIRASEWAQRLKGLLPPLYVPPWADHDSFARAEFEAEGLETLPAIKSNVNAGLEAVSRALQPLADGAPGLLLLEDPEAVDPFFGLVDTKVLAEEIDGYHYKAHKEGSPDPRDEPVKENDHACDALRYLVTGWEGLRGGPPAPPTAAKPLKRATNALTLNAHLADED